MKRIRPAVMTLVMAFGFHPALAQISSEQMNSIKTPDKLETSIGTLEFKDGAPSEATVTMPYDFLDRMHAGRFT